MTPDPIKPQSFQTVMSGAQLSRALANAMATGGTFNSKEHGEIKATKVMITDPETQNVITVNIKLGKPKP